MSKIHNAIKQGRAVRQAKLDTERKEADARRRKLEREEKAYAIEAAEYVESDAFATKVRMAAAKGKDKIQVDRAQFNALKKKGYKVSESWVEPNNDIDYRHDGYWMLYLVLT